MTDDALVRFTAHQLPREDLHALMRSGRRALLRAAWHLGVLAVTGAVLWRFRATAWVVPLLVAHGYVLAFLFCTLHETAHRTAFRSRWLNAVVGTVSGFLSTMPTRRCRSTPCRDCTSGCGSGSTISSRATWWPPER